jgi:two-component system phosphate regulon sensor histidine kinase PhoR
MHPKLIWIVLVIAVVGYFSADSLVTSMVRNAKADAIEERLASTAANLAMELGRIPTNEVQSWVVDAAGRTGARVSLIDANGKVIADSEAGVAGIPDLSNARDVRAALAGRSAAWFAAEEPGGDMAYAAVPLRPLQSRARERAVEPPSASVMRIARPSPEVGDAAATVRFRLAIAWLLSLAVLLAAGLILSRSMNRRVRALRDFAEAFPAAEPPPPAPSDLESDDISDLARALSGMAARSRGLLETLRVESARREAILASMVEGVLAVDANMRVMFCNDAFARALGARVPVPDGLPLLQVTRHPEIIEMLSSVRATGQPSRRRVQSTTPLDRAFEVLVSPLAATGKAGAIVLLHDITELERLERIRKDFVANVSHELRTPLTAIRGYAETLLDGALEDSQNNRKFLEIIQAHAIRLNNIASDLLAVSELDAAKPALDRECLSVREALQTAVNTLESEARVRGVRIVQGEVPDLHILGHKLRLEQALVNLLDNAVKFNRQGGEVRVEATASSAHTVKMTIADTGIGIPSEDLPRIFERFYRVDKARSRAVGGTGLGLSIVKHAIENMDGSISVESKLGKGSSFTVVLPAC